MGYFGEFRQHWRALLASTIGMATGSAVAITTAALFAPALIKEFGWSRADYALIGTLSLSTILVFPLIGMLTDRFGVKRVASVGIVFLPFSYLFATTFLSGALWQYFLLYFLQTNIGGTTTSMVYSRLIATRYDRARGLALAIGASGSAVLMSIGGPFLGHLIDTEGWRAAYRVLLIFSIGAGIVTWLLIPSDRTGSDTAEHAPAPNRRFSRAQFAEVLGSRPFWIIGGGLWLSYVPHTLFASQFKLMLLEQHMTSAEATGLVSFFALTVIGGRFLCGAALDRFPTHAVAAISMAIPALGFVALAAPLDSRPVIVGSVVLLGMAMGAEIDLLSYLVSRFFDRRLFGSVYGLIFSGLGIFSAIGSGVLSVTLRTTGTFSLFLNLMAAAMIASALLFWVMKGLRPKDGLVAPEA